MSLIDLYINDGGNIRRIGDDPHDMLMIWKGKLWYHNLQNGDGCRLGEESEWYSFVENADEYGYNCDPRKTENSSEKANNSTSSKMEQVEDEPQTCNTCKRGEWYRHGYDITMMDDECGGCCSWRSKWIPKTEPQYDFGEYADRLWKIAYERGKREALEQTEPTISKMEQVDKDINVRCKDEPKICDTCRYYNSNIPCGSTPSACKEADKFAEEFVDGLKKLKPKDEPQRDCFLCKWLGDVDVCGRCRNRNLFAEADTEPKPKDEPQIYVINPQEPTNDDKCFKCDDFFTCDGKCDEIEDEPQTERHLPDYSYEADLGRRIMEQTDCPWK